MGIKKSFIYLLLIIFPFSFLSCKVDFQRKKPTNYYYTNLLGKSLTLQDANKAVVVEMNFNKEKVVPKEDIETIKNLIRNLKKSNFIEKPKELPAKPAYKILLSFKDDKYVINIYNDRFLSIHPWDGTHPMDYIDMNNIEISQNLFYICKYITDN